MDYATNYELWYTGEGMHRILGAAKGSILSDAATATRAAEKVLDMAGFDRYVSESILPSLGYPKVRASYIGDRQIAAVHAKDSANIRSRWAYPQMSEEELSQALFQEQLEREKDKLAEAIEKSGGLLIGGKDSPL